MPLLPLVLLAVSAVPLLGEAAVPAGTASGDCTDSLNSVEEACQKSAEKIFTREPSRDTENIKRELRSLQGQVAAMQGQLAILDQRLSPAGGGTGDCPAGWSHRGSSCYLVPPMKLPWMSALKTCAAFDRRARLASIHLDNKDHIQTLLADRSYSMWYWVGMFRLSNAEDWAWIDGMPFDFKKWANREPNNINGMENCGWIFGNVTTWNDGPCFKHNFFLCEIKMF